MGGTSLEISTVQAAFKDRREIKATKAIRVQRVQTQVWSVPRAIRGLQAIPDHKGLPATTRAWLVHRVHRVTKARRDHKAIKGRKAPKAMMVLKVHKDRQEQTANRTIKESRGTTDHKGHRDHKETTVLKALKAMMAHPAQRSIGRATLTAALATTSMTPLAIKDAPTISMLALWGQGIHPIHILSIGP
jgi:hypothetical protein